MKSLCKLFYADPQAYAAAYEKRFHDPDTVHLDLCIGENPAFSARLQISIDGCSQLNEPIMR